MRREAQRAGATPGDGLQLSQARFCPRWLRNGAEGYQAGKESGVVFAMTNTTPLRQ